jgi:uncharacterized protein (DUF697 family)
MATNDKENAAKEVPAKEIPAKEVPVTETVAKEASAESSVKETVQDQTALNQRIKRIDKAHVCFKNYTIGAIAVGFVPVPLADMAALTAIQLKMVHSLAAIYDVPFSKNITKSIIGSVLGGSIAVTLALPVASFIKLIPIIGQSSGIISTAAIGAASTYAIGKIFAQHFESGGTFLDFDEEKARAHFKELYEEGKAFVSAQQSTTA